ncbi:MAG: HAMP domain-containing protein [Coriobacteriia bacterium]|nr:HAMP domain-containing protein [Coriobacteriia bacterium]
MTRSRPRVSVRLWQTALFVAVVGVAMGLLWALLIPGLEGRLETAAAEEQLRAAGEVAAAAGRAYPLTVESRERLRGDVERIRSLLGGEVWVYDLTGTEIVGSHGDAVPEALLRRAQVEGLADSPPFAEATVSEDGLAIASRAVFDHEGRRAGSVVVAHPTRDAGLVLEAARSRLRTTFWLASMVAGLVGLGFSEIISRRVHLLTRAAHAIAEGDFDQRLPKSLMPDDIRDLADVYNVMAERLGEVFEALREQEREIAAVVRSMAEAVVALDADGAVRILNPAAETILFMKAEDLLGRYVDEAIVHEDVLRLAHEGLAGRPSWDTVELGRRILRVHATPILGDDSPSGVVLLLSDVTEQTLADEAQRRFIAHASHEMRTPISAMKGFLELLQGPAREDERVREDFLSTMRLEVERLSRLVASLFTLAQSDAGRLHVDMRPHAFSEIAEDVLALMRPVMEEAGMAMRTDLAPGRLCVLADRDRIMQALIALVDNAVKYASAGREVVLGARVEGAGLVVEVADSGPGIPEESLPLLFERFYRVEGYGGGGQGAGLGLAIVKEIAEAHGTGIEVESRPGSGSVFRFTLPCAGGCRSRRSVADVAG